MLLKYLCFSGSKNANSSEKCYPTVIEELCHQFSLEDLRKSTNNFDRALSLGTGGFGTVYKGCLKHNGTTDYTIELKRWNRRSPSRLSEFVTEIELLCQLRHPNLVALVGFCNHKKEKIIVYEYMPNRSLQDRLNSRDMEPLSWKKRIEICIGAARGLHYLHAGAKRTVFHRAVKPSNILLDNNMVPKLSDFGISLQGPLSTSKPKPIEANVEGTFGYLAPELDRSGIISDRCDVYSFGMVLLQAVCTRDDNMIVTKAKMLASQQLRESGSQYDRGILHFTMLNFVKKFPVEEIIDPNLNGKIAPECWEVFIDITKRCLKFEPEERPTIGEVELLLEHALSLQEEADIRKTDGTYGYMAPEYAIMENISDKSDVYSFGKVLLQVVCTKERQTFINMANMQPIQEGSGRAIANEYLEGSVYDPTNLGIMAIVLGQFPIEEIIDPILKGKIAPECWEVFMDITKRCLKPKPDERPTIGEVEVLLDHALSRQEEADIRKTNGDYALLTTTMVFEPPICRDDQEASFDYATQYVSSNDEESD